MNSSHEPNHALQRDLFATAAARLRRRVQLRRAGLASLTVLAMVASLSMLARYPGSDALELSATDPLAVPSSPPVPPTQPEAPALVAPTPAPASAPYRTVESDDELLALLKDQGPLLITHPDGSRQLILTRPNRTGGF